jgi:two-component system, OmpR family, KDP operon response regulator KdpE
MIKILAVDDEPPLLRALVLVLSNRGYAVSTAINGATAVSAVAIHPPDLVILDLGLPDIDGLEVITHVRRLQPELPIIVLSARTGSGDKVAALDLGAVDYVTKPFNMDELLARLRAATRRVDVTEPVPTLVAFGQVTIDLDAHLILGADGHADEPIHLTPTEWRMLEVLLSRPGSLVTTAEVLTAMRGNPENTERSYLRIYMQQLRRKLEPDPSRPRHLLTEPGMGYRFKP